MDVSSKARHRAMQPSLVARLIAENKALQTTVTAYASTRLAELVEWLEEDEANPRLLMEAMGKAEWERARRAFGG